MSRMVSYGIRWWGLFLLSMAVIIAGLWTFKDGYMLAAFALFFMAPSLWLLSFGTLRNRLLNALPAFTLLAGLYLGFRFDSWEASSRLWTMLPFVGLVLKPRRHPLKYGTMIITVMFLFLDYVLGWTVPWVYRILFIVWIYAIFIPPIILNRVKKMLHLFKREF
ncbi:MAG: hypothetical protein ACLFUQ_05790 [Candidatus Izemoplasmataceae bacterium]